MDESSPFDQARRAFLERALAAGSLVALPGLAGGEPVGEISGQVWVNGERVDAAMNVPAGALVETGSGGRFTFAIGKDAFMLRENSRVHLGSRDNLIVHAARVITGALMAVFGGGFHTVGSNHMTAGVRGTGIYLETTRDDTYFCLCYGVGEAQLSGPGTNSAGPDPGSEILAMSSASHGAYRFVPGAESAEERIMKAGLENHTGAELYMLEKLVGRTPPFAMGQYGHSGGPSTDGR